MNMYREFSFRYNGLLLLGCSLLLTGLVFYANLRSGTWLHSTALLDALRFLDVEPGVSSGFIVGSLPSFLFVIYMSVFSRITINEANVSILKIAVFWSAISILSEIAQRLPEILFLIGTFDPIDIVASLLGGMVAYLVLRNTAQNRPADGYFQLQKIRYIPVSIMAFASIMGTSTIDDLCDNQPSDCVTPVYLSLEMLRTDIEPDLGDTAILKRPGKIYLYQNYLLVVEKYLGIHIFDNTDKQNPMRITFLPIKGATELSIQGSYLYTNSFGN